MEYRFNGKAFTVIIFIKTDKVLKLFIFLYSFYKNVV